MDRQTPLHGIRVLDLTNVLAGPFCCHQLAHLGAEVIKVEVPKTGDLARQLGADPELNKIGMGVSFLAQNAGKKSVTANLKSEGGKEVLRRLVASADVLVENYRPGVMDRLGVGYEALRDINPRLIYCAISGFGQTGDWSNRPAYDQIVQGASGVMAITGDTDSAPLRVGFPVADTVGGLTAAMAISAALNAPKRGAYIDISMLESLIATMGWAVLNYLVADQRPTANGNENLTSAPSGTFRAKDGPLNIAANKDEQWVILAQHIGRADLLARPEYATRELRKRNRAALKAEIDAALAAKPAADWAEDLNKLGVPASEVFDLPAILDHPVIRGRDLIATFDAVAGVARPVSVLRTGVKIDGAALSVPTPPPAVGEDADAILRALGYEADEISTMRERGEI